jgi:hypothetical protein
MAAQIAAAQKWAMTRADDDNGSAAFAGDHVALRNENLKNHGAHGQDCGPISRDRAISPTIDHGGDLSQLDRSRNVINNAV